MASCAGASFLEDGMPDRDDKEWPPHLDALAAAPANHRLLFEDEALRVLEVTVAPGERENLHHHRWPSLMVVLARPNYRNFDADGNEIPPSGGTSTELPRPAPATAEAALHRGRA
jgi:hypothetical protein